MSLRDIPVLLMRGGTSRAPYFLAEDLPGDRDALARVLIAAMGAGSPLQVDGIGGGQPTTSKTAILSPSDDGWAEVDYLFAQVHAERAEVDFGPSCGNILAGVGPAAIEMGLVAPGRDETRVRIRAVNTGARIEARVQSPGGRVEYEGDVAIAGVPGTAAPVTLDFRDVVGNATGALLPTGSARDTIDGVEVSCIDVAMPMVIARADAFALSGHESAEALDADRAFYDRMEPIRLEAGRRMGLGDVSRSVVPKFGLLSAARAGGTIAARYFMPWNAHPSMAVTGAQCIASCALVPGTVAEGLLERPAPGRAIVTIEHASGTIDVTVEYALEGGEFRLESAGLVRTARLLAQGSLMVPGSIWAGRGAGTG